MVLVPGVTQGNEDAGSVPDHNFVSSVTQKNEGARSVQDFALLLFFSVNQ